MPIIPWYGFSITSTQMLQTSFNITFKIQNKLQACMIEMHHKNIVLQPGMHHTGISIDLETHGIMSTTRFFISTCHGFLSEM